MPLSLATYVHFTFINFVVLVFQDFSCLGSGFRESVNGNMAK
ncbi:hypothetical protein T01_5564 [Trichinella spiralis]|uniref:Uncharacterized protein n=1 Tax=Trichinella spiralis TaxID=6334 RepID=A0A0V1AL68_TRISP|nr:hypothetical protein T01_5564 [Trichinella spiralis]